MRLLPHVLVTPVVCALLVPADAVAFEQQFELSDRRSLGAVRCRWSQAGLAVQLAHDSVTNVVRVVPGATRMMGPAVAGNALFLPPPPLATNLVWLALKRQPHRWTLYLDGAPVARLPELSRGSATLAVEAAALPDEAQRDSFVQRLGSFRFDDAFMVPEGQTLSETWETLSGTWTLHAVTNRLVTPGVNNPKPSRVPTIARSPNFYSLEGVGTPALILTGETFHDAYSVRAAVQHNAGTNGILFLATEAGDCHGLTARTDPETEHLVIELWRGRTDDWSARRVLNAFQTDLTPGQWLQLEAVVSEERLVILADGIELWRRHCPDLPPGGRYGLVACTAEGTRFDDFSASSHEDYPFDCAEAFAAATRQTVGQVSLRGFAADAPLPRPATLTFAGRGERLWRFGTETDAPHRLSVRFLPEPGDAPATLGLLIGGDAPGAPRWHFTCLLTTTNRIFSLSRDDGTNRVVVDRMRLPPSDGRGLRLTLDALRAGELRAFADERQVLFTRTDLPLGGTAAITVAGGRTVSASLPEYTTRSVTYADRFEKNLQYVNDPFMRHWASPEGQWHTSREGLTWLRGDMIRRVRLRMPATETPSFIHLATDEAGSNPVCRLEIRDGAIHAVVPSLGPEPRFSVAVTNIPLQSFEGNVAHRLYTVGLEDHVLWLGDDTRLLATTHLPAPAEGRRIRIEGFAEPQLRFSLVRRENVFDTLFNESLQNWTINGGQWEVVNRFQCEPTWSHMNGENADSLAALWSKYDFSGDFCAELYAGIRHGVWYNRCGDLNMTVLSRRGNTGDGYTVTVTGWNPDHSQNDTRLFRDGVLMTNTASYLVPRIREGNVRRGGYEPMVPGGRDVHGAWYGIRLRRTGGRVQLVFDNLPALEYADPEPLAAGCFGVWTFRNSMMVARVRIVAESVSPRRFAFRALAPDAPAPTGVPADPDDFPLPPQTVNGLPPNALTPACWVADDPVSRPVVRFRRGDAGPEMHVTAHHGGGTFLVTNRMPAIATQRLLGWRFDLARSPDAAFNLEFTSGRVSQEGFAAVQQWSFVLSGSDDTRGPRQLAGRHAAPPSPSPDAPRWTTVTAWLPCELLSSDCAVRLDGFGNLQPSDVQQGLLGNPPGAWYAVRNFRPVFRGRPELGGIADRAVFEQVTAAIAALPPEQLNTLTLPPEIDPDRSVIEWAIPPDVAFGLTAARDPDHPDTATVFATTPWNSPLLPPRAVRIDDQPATFTFGSAVCRVFLPRNLKNRQPVLSVELADGRTFRQTLQPPPTPPGTPPLLLALELPEGRLTTFEDRPFDTTPFALGAQVALMRGDRERGTVLKIANRGTPTRLESRLATAYDALVTPLVQFNYRAEPMSRFSLTSGRSQISFTEPWGLPATLGGALVTDGTWQTWLGTPLAALGEARIAEGLDFPATELRTGSRLGHDQSGLYSTLLIDDLAFGPAVGPSRILAFRALYDDPEGDLAAVQYALVPGPQPWTVRTDAERAAARWTDTANAEVTTPSTDGLPEGTHHLVVRARDTAGNLSAVADMPFLLDRTPPAVTHAIDPTELYNKTCLKVRLTGDHAFPSLRGMQLTCNGTELKLAADNGRAFFSASHLQLEIDWPWLLRRQLQTAKHGDIFTLAFTGVADISGNKMPRFEIPITVNTAADKTPPTVQAVNRPENVQAWLPLIANPAEFFQQFQTAAMQNKEAENGSFVTEFKTLDNGSAALRRAYRTEPGWETTKHGWIGFSIRTLAGDAGAPPVVEIRLVPRAIPEKANKPKQHGAYTLQLPAPGASHPAVSGAITWKAGEWQNILVDAHAFLRSEAGADAVPDIREVVLAFPEKTPRTFQIRSAAILAPYDEKQVVRFRAYDVSGMAGLVWSGGRAAELTIRPSRVARPRESAWLDVRVSDRAGNLSPVYMIPVPPVALPDSLPAEIATPD